MRIVLREHCSANKLGFPASIKCTTERCFASRMSFQKRAAPYGKCRPRYQPYGRAGSNKPSAGTTISSHTTFYQMDDYSLLPSEDVQWEGGNYALSHLRLHFDSCGLRQIRSPDYEKCLFSLPLADVFGDLKGLRQSIAKPGNTRYCRRELGEWRLAGATSGATIVLSESRRP